MTTTLGLKELRENTDKYIARVKRGESFIVARKSKPVFKIVPPDSEEQWETIVDFTEIHKDGVSARDVLKALREINAES